MSVFGASASRRITETDLGRAADLSLSLSRRLARIQLEDFAPAIAESLEQISAVTGLDGCRLVEFTESGSVARQHVPTSIGNAAGGRPVAPALDQWLVDRLARGELVVVSRPDDLPRDATAARERARRTGACSILGAPSSVAGQVVCALVVDRLRFMPRWPQPLVELLQLLSDIVGAAVQRGRHEAALRANVAEIERLNAQLQADNVYLKEEINSRHDFDDIVGESAALRLALARLSQVASTNASVLLLGRTGTGKELFARALHERSRRHARPLVCVNCAALPSTLVESELFGHEKGSFTGAVSARQGRFELADGGTIFLDEIGDLALEVQVKLLRVLQEREFERVGSSATRKVDVRVVAATHQDLEKAVVEGRFRADLYYRLSVYPIRLPSLYERAEDIPRLVWFFVQRHQRNLGRHIEKIPQGVMDTLQEYSWPGNIRELENVVERALIASKGDTLRLDEHTAFGGERVRAAEGAETLDCVQRAHIQAVLERCGWLINGKGNSAERLGLHPNTLRFRMKKLGLVCPDPVGRQRRSRSAGN